MSEHSGAGLKSCRLGSSTRRVRSSRLALTVGEFKASLTYIVSSRLALTVCEFKASLYCTVSSRLALTVDELQSSWTYMTPCLKMEINYIYFYSLFLAFIVTSKNMPCAYIKHCKRTSKK